MKWLQLSCRIFSEKIKMEGGNVENTWEKHTHTQTHLKVIFLAICFICVKIRIKYLHWNEITETIFPPGCPYGCDVVVYKNGTSILPFVERNAFPVDVMQHTTFFASFSSSKLSFFPPFPPYSHHTRIVYYWCYYTNNIPVRPFFPSSFVSKTTLEALFTCLWISLLSIFVWFFFFIFPPFFVRLCVYGSYYVQNPGYSDAISLYLSLCVFLWLLYTYFFIVSGKIWNPPPPPLIRMFVAPIQPAMDGPMVVV